MKVMMSALALAAVLAFAPVWTAFAQQIPTTKEDCEDAGMKWDGGAGKCVDN